MSTERAGRPGYLTLVCQGATRATRLNAFPDDDPLEAMDVAGVLARMSLPGRRWNAVFTSPATSARQTAEALRLEATPLPELADCGFGRWRGQRLHEVQAREPAALETWLSDLSAAPHGGDSLQGVGERALGWLDGLLTEQGQIIAITNSIVIRWLIVGVLEAPSRSFWRIDVTPLSCVELATNGIRWSLRIG